jgi:endonuclease-8
MPEGDTLHLLAAKVAPLVGGTVVRLVLPRSDQPTRALIGRCVDDVRAHGKNLIVSLSGPAVLVHLKMTGSVRLQTPPVRAPAAAVSLALETERLALVALRAPTVRIVSAAGLREHLARLGPDPVDPAFDVDEAVRRLRARADVPLALALTDQAAIAGIGNEWKSELLFDQRLDPFAKVAAFSDAELAALAARAAEVMRRTVASRQFARRMRPGRFPLAVYDRAGEPSLDCGAPIVRQYQGRPGETPRSTYSCHRCQVPRG